MKGEPGQHVCQEQYPAGDILILLREAVALTCVFIKLVWFTVFVSIMPCLEDYWKFYRLLCTKYYVYLTLACILQLCTWAILDTYLRTELIPSAVPGLLSCHATHGDHAESHPSGWMMFWSWKCVCGAINPLYFPISLGGVLGGLTFQNNFFLTINNCRLQVSTINSSHRGCGHLLTIYWEW